ncbi:MAG: hypothetical protein MJ172_05225 [Clostridia bacterium]|nr:hypothetical protein [Clostridia bacterium]
MTAAFGTMSKTLLSFIGFWSFALFLGTILILSLEFNKSKKSPLKIFVSSIVAIITYILFQCETGIYYNHVTTPHLLDLINTASSIPFCFILFICISITIEEILFVKSNIIWEKNNITSNSIKEAIDTFPVGVCLYDKNGRIMLKNTTIEQLCILILDEALFDGLLFENELKNYPATDTLGDRKIIILKDNSVWTYTKQGITIDGDSFDLLTFMNLTEEYEKTQILLSRRKAVQELNVKLAEYNRDIVSIITSQEILNAKIKIHDELGAGLLAIRHYLMNGGNKKDKEEIVARLNRNIEFLQNESVSNNQDEYQLMFSTAKTLDVSISVIGELPADEPYKHIIATAIHESLTNTIRHARGNTINIVAKRTDETIKIIFSNNGEQPNKIVTEGSGLSSLRKMIEEISGTMKITTDNGFILNIILPVKEKNNGI